MAVSPTQDFETVLCRFDVLPSRLESRAEMAAYIRNPAAMISTPGVKGSRNPCDLYRLQ